MDPHLSQIGASPKSVWKPKQAHAQNTLSQPAQTLEQIVHPHKPRTNTNPEKSARSPASGLAVDPRRYLNRGSDIKNTKGQAPLDTPKARMRSSLALIIRQKNFESRTRDPSAYNSRWSYIILSHYNIFPVFTGEMSVLV
jgi:hypothetical protein